MSTLNGLSSGDVGLDSNLILFSSNDFSLLIGELLLFFDSDGSDLQYFFKFGNLLLSLCELNHTTVVFLTVVIELFSLDTKHRFEQLDQFEERLGSGVDVSTLSSQDNGREVLHGGEREGEEINNGVTFSFRSHFNFFKELACDGEQRFLRPGMEPINNSAVNDGGELTGTRSEVITGRHA